MGTDALDWLLGGGTNVAFDWLLGFSIELTLLRFVLSCFVLIANALVTLNGLEAELDPWVAVTI